MVSQIECGKAYTPPHVSKYKPYYKVIKIIVPLRVVLFAFYNWTKEDS